MSDQWKQIHADWDDSQMVVAIRYPSTIIGSAEKTVVMAQVETFNARLSTPHDVNHGLNNHNMGKIKKPATFTFDISVFPYGQAVDLLNKCQFGDRYFDLVMAPASYFDNAQTLEINGNVGSPTGNVWVEGRSIFKGAWVNDRSSRFSIGGKPLETFSCQALRYEFDQDQDGQGSLEIGNGFSDTSATDSEVGLDDLRDVGGPA